VVIFIHRLRAQLARGQGGSAHADVGGSEVQGLRLHLTGNQEAGKKGRKTLKTSHGEGRLRRIREAGKAGWTNGAGPS
jgi:hypothetical protein